VPPTADPTPNRGRRRLTIAGVVVGVLLLLVVVGPFVYIHVFAGSTPAKLSLSSGTTTTAADGTTSTSSSAPVPLAGTWQVGSGSKAGYRVEEVLFGQSTTAVGRTEEVTGSMTVVGTVVTRANFVVDMRTITSNKSQRDSQFQGIMDTADFPHATFVLTSPIPLGTPPTDGKIITVQATGRLTLHGQTHTVTTPLQAERDGNTIKVLTSIPVKFSDYGIANPSASFVTTQDHGTIEVLLSLTPAS
jgi:polyisoprenoid-binding protein YceI